MTSLEHVSDIFECCEKEKILLFPISHSSFKDYSSFLKKFKDDVGEDIEDFALLKLFRLMSRFGITLCTSPVDFSYTKEQSFDYLRELRKISKQLKFKFSNWDEQFEKCVRMMEGLYKSPKNPLLEKIIELNKKSNHESKNAIVVGTTEAIGPTKNTINRQYQTRNLRVLSEHSLYESDCYENLYIFGTPRFYSKRLYKSPRAKNIYYIYFDWLNGTIDDKANFASNIEKTSFQYIQYNEHVQDKGFSTSDVFNLNVGYSADEIAKRHIQNASGQGLEHEEVNAKLFLLENDYAVFVEAENDAKSLILNLSEGGVEEEKVAKVENLKFKASDYILLKTDGDGDYIIPMADRILGGKAKKLRSMQREWKNNLLHKSIELGTEVTIQVLNDLGCDIASKTNLRNWTSCKNIKTRRYSDFKAILDLCEMGRSSKDYWEAMKEISEAHQKAGARIRKNLIEKVNQTDSLEILTTGYIEFNLDIPNCGKIAAFRIKEIKASNVKVPARSIGQPFQLEL